MLRNDERVLIPQARGALLASDQARILLDPVPLPVEDHDVEADGVVLGRGAPGDGAGPFAVLALVGDENIQVEESAVPDGADAAVLVIVGNRRADVALVTVQIPVDVLLCRVGDRPAVIAGISDMIAVGIELTRIGDRRAVVAGVSELVPIGVELTKVDDARAIVADVPDFVAILIALIRVSHRNAVIARISDPVAVDVALIRVIDVVGQLSKEPHSTSPSPSRSLFWQVVTTLEKSVTTMVSSPPTTVVL